MEIMLNGQLVSCTPKEYKELLDMGFIVNYPRPKGSELLFFASTELLVHGKHIASLAYRQLPQRRVVPTTQLDYGF